MSEENSLKLFQEVHKLNPSAIVELFELNASDIGDDNILYFTNGTTGHTGDPVSFNGQTYTPLPIIIKGFESKNDGTPPRPVMTISNVNGWMSFLMQATKDLVGAKITRRRTFAKYLDGQPEAANVQYPPDVYIVEQKLRENRLVVEFELGCGYDLDGVVFPVRQVTSGICGWDYRESGCSFSGRYCVTDRNNTVLNGATNITPWEQGLTYAAGRNVTFADASDVFGVYQALQTASGASQGPQNTVYWKRVQRYRGEYDAEVTDYTTGDVIFITRFNRRQFYYCSWQHSIMPCVPQGTMPPNIVYWTADVCSKTLQGCRYRFDPTLNGNPIPFGGFPGTLNLPEVL
jgi:lambda family phage minor tail protein L